MVLLGFALTATALLLVASLYFAVPTRRTATGEADVPARFMHAVGHLLPGGLRRDTTLRVNLIVWSSRALIVALIAFQVADVLKA